MSFGKPKAGIHHSARQVRLAYKVGNRRIQKHLCPFCGRNMTKQHNKEMPDHVRP